MSSGLRLSGWAFSTVARATEAEPSSVWTSPTAWLSLTCDLQDGCLRGGAVAEYLGPDSRPMAAEDARALLSADGTEVHPLSAEDEVVLAMFGDDPSAFRGETDLSPPADEVAAAAGMAAWHVNEKDEGHTVRSGTGLMQFMTDSGPVSVILQPGDVLVIRGAEH